MMFFTRKLRQCRKLLIVLSNPVWRRGLLRGAAAAVEHRHLLATLDIATCIDIGANIGQFSLLIRGLFPEAYIFAFEPLNRPCETYRRVMHEDQRAQLFPVAIAPEKETRVMHVSARIDSSSLLPITTSQTEFAPGTEWVGTQSVMAEPIDNMMQAKDVRAPALLKLDVQGFELEALKGCASLLPLFSYVYAELSFKSLYAGQALADETIAWLASNNFRLAGINNPSYDRAGNIVQADFLFCACKTSGNAN